PAGSGRGRADPGPDRRGHRRAGARERAGSGTRRDPQGAGPGGLAAVLLLALWADLAARSLDGPPRPAHRLVAVVGRLVRQAPVTGAVRFAVLAGIGELLGARRLHVGQVHFVGAQIEDAVVDDAEHQPVGEIDAGGAEHAL